MTEFEAAPAIPSGYSKLLAALTREEIERARAAAYVSDESDPRGTVRRAGMEDSYKNIPPDNLNDWRIRTYVFWFCYIYENLLDLQRPMGALEEIILEFGAPSALDLAGRRLGTLDAGAGAADPLPALQLRAELEKLKPHYQLAIDLLIAVALPQ